MVVYQPPFMDLAVFPAWMVEDCPGCCPRLWFAAAPGGGSEEWRGASLWESLDDSAFEEIAPVLVPATMGSAEDALGNTAFATEFDGTNTVTVRLSAGTLSNATAAEVRAGKNWAILGSEVIAFQTATLQSDGTYLLEDLLRGRRGTEGAMGGHGEGDVFCMLLEDGSLVEREYQSKEVGSGRYFRAVAAGGLVADALSYQVTVPMAAGEMHSVAHGLSVLDVVYASGVGTVALAKADAAGTLAHMVVVAVTGLDTLIVSANGRYRAPAHGLTPGSQYYLSAATAGALTTTPPGSGNYVQQVLVPVDADHVLVNVGTGVLV